MRDEYTNKHGYLNRYFIRWVTATNRHGELIIMGWAVCDRNKFDKIEIQRFDVSEKAQAEAICKLMNSIEEENDGVSK